MASSGIPAFGINVTYGGTEIKELTNVGWGLGTPEQIDITNHDSPSAYEEFVAGIIKHDTIDLEANFVPADAGQQALATALQARTAAEVVITHPDTGAATVTGDAKVIGFKTQHPVTGKMALIATLKWTEPPTFAP